MRLASVVVLLAAAPTVVSHSWVACTDYRGDVNYYEESRCFGYPRYWKNRGANALSEQATGYHIGQDTGFNFMPGAPCQSAKATPVSDAYSSAYPAAVYEAGKTYCLAWPQKNHAAATCTNQFIPDTSTRLFAVQSDANDPDPTAAEFKANNVNNPLLNTPCSSTDISSDDCQLGMEKHQNGVMDCKGFQRSPRFCDNTDKAMGTGCFVAPTTPGEYVLQWLWEFNRGGDYATCFDATVVAAGAGNGGGGTTGTPQETAGSGLTGACTNNALRFGSVDDTPDVTTPAPSPLASAALAGTEFVFRDIPSIYSIVDKGDTFEVVASYTASAGRTLIVDVLNTDGRRFGTGSVALASTSDPVTVTVEVELTRTIPDGGRFLWLRGVIVPTEFADDDDTYMDYDEDRQMTEVCFSSDSTLIPCLNGENNDDGSSNSGNANEDADGAFSSMGSTASFTVGTIGGFTIGVAGVFICLGLIRGTFFRMKITRPSEPWSSKQKDTEII